MNAPASETNWVPIAISMISAVIALVAMIVTFAKYRMDLYDRRFAIYTATLDLYLALFNEEREGVKKAMVVFMKGVRESQFLFSDRSGIFKKLEEFRVEAVKMKARSEERAKPKPDTDLLKALSDDALESPIILEKGLKDLEVRLRPYLTYRVIDLKLWRYRRKRAC